MIAPYRLCRTGVLMLEAEVAFKFRLRMKS
jgi:hypothetical protein